MIRQQLLGALLGIFSLSTTAARVEEARFMKLGGIEQWITVRGEDASKPILLFIHGGPADVQSPLVSTYAPYEHDFVLVQWDQRGAGRTYGKYGERTPNLNLEQLTRDGIELTKYLRKRFNKPNVIVLGHSWGTAIATEMAHAQPNLFAAYVGTGQIASWPESVQYQFDFLKAKAKEMHNATILSELEAIGTPDPMNARQYFTFTRPLRSFMGDADKQWLGGLLELARQSPGMTDELMKTIGDGMAFSGRTLLPIQMRERLSTNALEFKLPYYVIQGEEDLFTPTAPAKAYFEKVSAPRKQMVILKGAGHFALVTHTPLFISTLKTMLNSETAAPTATPKY